MLRVFIVVLLVLPSLSGSACGKLRGEAAEGRARREQVAAIKTYSDATAKANAAQARFLEAFERANRSSSLEAYREALGRDVLPALDAFLSELEAMPVEQGRLAEIHAMLVDAYKEARAGIAALADTLVDRAALSGFDVIRTRLQSGVSAYREALREHYRAHGVELRLEAAPPTSASAAGPTGAAP